ncbi:uridine kinase [uncultured Arcticibacterium sp.]|uniref:uridine kinase n=1 Tax=uncultured Arcticibacterium sp. TaxID=2173042 RepID=UPI0030FA5340
MVDTHRKKPFVIGITGGSASGKTFFLKSLLKEFSEEEVCLISQDNYYKENKHIPRDGNDIENYDLPECIDFESYASHIKSLIEGETVNHLEYTFNNPDKVPEMLVHKPAPIIVVEGLFVFYEKSLSDLLDIKVFIDAREKIKIKRRIKRDNEVRGYDMDDVLYRWENHVTPTYKKFIKPTKKSADVVINNNDHFDNGLWMLTTFVRSILNQSKS